MPIGAKTCWSSGRKAPRSSIRTAESSRKNPYDTTYALLGTDGHVDLNKGGKSVDQKAYRSMIGSLLYLCASRSDIMLSVCMCARYQSDPRCHLMAVKRILRYLVSMPCFGIWYPKGSTFDLIGYSAPNNLHSTERKD